MKTKTISILLMGLLYINISLAQTHHDKYIHVADTIVNLADVDLEKGIKIKRKQFGKKNNDGKIMNYKTGFEVFVSPERDFYAVVLDTVRWFKGSYYGEYQSILRYFNGNNEILFEKTYTGLYLSAFVYYISSGGEILVVSVSGEDRENLYVLKSNGNIINEYDGERDIYIGPLHKHSFIRDNYIYNGPNNYDFIDEHGNVKKVEFPVGFLRGIKFSPYENYYNVSLDDDILLNNINHELIWRTPKDNMGAVNITWDEKRYMIYNYTNKAIEVKDLFNHKLIYSIDEVYYKNVRYPINRWDIIDSCFYTIGKTDSIYIYNFYNQNGKIIKVQTVPYVKRIKPYIVYRKQSEFFIKPRKTKF